MQIGHDLYEFGHLEPFQIVVSSEKVGRPLRLHVRFSSHCFSESYDPKGHPQGTLTFRDGSRQRVFNLERYELSRRLPGLLQDLNIPR